MSKIETFISPVNPGPKAVEISSLPIDLSTGRVTLAETQQSVALYLFQNPQAQRSLSSKLRNNSQATPFAPELFGLDQPRPLSAYFFLVTRTQAVIIETGLVATDGIASIHNDMHNAQGHKDRERLCDIEVSGHVWQVPQLGISVALFDRYERHQQLGPQGEELVKALTQHGYVCIGTEGLPLYSPRDLSPSLQRAA